MTDERFQKYFNHHETVSSLAEKYGITRQTLRTWLKPIKHKLNFSASKTFMPSDLKSIIEFLGEYPVDDLDDLEVK